MPLFQIPQWLHQHTYINKSFKDLTPDEINDLKERLSRFRHNAPDVSVVIPAWNEENNIYRSLSSLASNVSNFNIEIIVINNNSTDKTQEVLDRLGVISYFQPTQGISFARQLGLEKAKGKYHLCADSDTLYPPYWIDSMVRHLSQDNNIVGVYGRYHFIPGSGSNRLGLWLYEKIAGIAITMRKTNQEFVNVLGFNMGFITEVGRANGGFKVNQVRKFDNAAESADYVEESEDGTMALNLLKVGKLKLVTDKNAWVYTSDRRLRAEGGLFKSFVSRLKRHSTLLTGYIKKK